MTLKEHISDSDLLPSTVTTIMLRLTSCREPEHLKAALTTNSF
jgi:hypothetical protein